MLPGLFVYEEHIRNVINKNESNQYEGYSEPKLITKELSKSIMIRSRYKNKYQHPLPRENVLAYKKNI